MFAYLNWRHKQSMTEWGSNWRTNVGEDTVIHHVAPDGDRRIFDNLSPINAIKYCMLAKMDPTLHAHCLQTSAAIRASRAEIWSS